MKRNAFPVHEGRQNLSSTDASYFDILLAAAILVWSLRTSQIYAANCTARKNTCMKLIFSSFGSLFIYIRTLIQRTSLWAGRPVKRFRDGELNESQICQNSFRSLSIIIFKKTLFHRPLPRPLS